MIKNTVTNAADISVFELIDNTFETGGGPVSIFGTVVEATKGEPFRAIKVTGTQWRKVFGKPMPMREGSHAEGLRHVAEAADEAQGVVVVRVVASDFLTPVMTFLSDGNVTHSGQAYNAVPVAGAGVNFMIYAKDGYTGSDRKVKLTWDNTKKRATLDVYEPDAANNDARVESLTFGFGLKDRDDMGRPAYIESVFEQQSDRLDVVVGEADTETVLTDVDLTVLSGGNPGGRPTTDDYRKAWDIYRNDRVFVNELFAAGCYDPVIIGNMAEICDGRHIEGRFDIPPYLDQDGAVQWQKDVGIQSRQMSAYWMPYKAMDEYYSVKAVWGASGAACASKAICNAHFTGDIPGVHYTPAGIKRGIINRRMVKGLFPDDVIDKDIMYANRINPILANETGPGVYIGDALTCHYLENYSRFNWVTAIDNYIVHRFVQAASVAKFEPDGLTAEILTDLMRDIRQDLITSGAIVTPREPEFDGNDPMVITIVQEKIDYWAVTWAYCPTGSARRISGQPMLVR